MTARDKIRGLCSGDNSYEEESALKTSNKYKRTKNHTRRDMTDQTKAGVSQVVFTSEASNSMPPMAQTIDDIQNAAEAESHQNPSPIPIQLPFTDYRSALHQIASSLFPV